MFGILALFVERYRASGGSDARFSIDREKAGITASAVIAVESIVNDNSVGSDTEKLYAYKDTICDLTSYNDDAAEEINMPYADPWKLI